jgi:hypothetical protein
LIKIKNSKILPVEVIYREKDLGKEPIPFQCTRAKFARLNQDFIFVLLKNVVIRIGFEPMTLSLEG